MAVSREGDLGGAEKLESPRMRREAHRLKTVPTVAVIMTCFNRRELTLSCLRSLLKQEGRLGPQEDQAGAVKRSFFQLQLYLMDDGSRDGTGEAVLDLWPSAHLLKGAGSLFWCGGMRKAWAAAGANDPDYYFLVNDDTVFRKEAVGSLLALVGGPEAGRIAVAAVADPMSGQPSYGGVRRDGKRLVGKGDEPIRADTFNANGVLIPRAVYRDLGGFHPVYTHAMGDYDYGFMAAKKGVEIWQSAEFLAECPVNPETGSWRDRSLPFGKRWELLQQPKGLPWKEWAVYCRRNYGWKAPLKFFSPILRISLGR